MLEPERHTNRVYNYIQGDERPFTYEDLRLMRKYFEVEEAAWFGFLNIVSAFIRFPMLQNILPRIDEKFSRTPL